MSKFSLRSARFRLLQPNKACVGANMRTVGSWGHYLQKKKKKIFDPNFFSNPTSPNLTSPPAFYEKKTILSYENQCVKYGPDPQIFDKY